MKHKRSALLTLRHAGRLFSVLLFFVSLLARMDVPVSAGTPTFPYNRFQVRSLRIDTTNPDAITTYRFSWFYPSVAAVGSLEFLFCTDPYFLDPCTTPTGASFASAVLSSQTGNTGFTIANQTAQRIELTRPSAATNGAQSTYTFTNVHNPTNPEVFYIRIWAYPTTNTTGPQNAVASVANATVNPIGISTIVPPILDFCVGITTDTLCKGGAPPVGDFIDYGQLDPTTTKYGSSQFTVATNATGGYVVTANGNTMTSGNKIIPSLTSPTASLPGTGQFGINLRANSVPPVGSDVTGAGTGTVGAGYDTQDAYKFVSGEVVGLNANPTLHNRYTASYIVNIPADQPAGVYTTTITYICSGTF